MNDASNELREQVLAARSEGEPVCIYGGRTKSFLGASTSERFLSTTGHYGIVSYEPTELVVTVRAGTSLAELQAALAEKNQMLAFEPPAFGTKATIGGTIACGLSGPRRPFTGSARDFTLGTRVLDGNGEVLAFGGQVMKNVAGYDVSRLMVGAMGTLGLVLDISLKVLPQPGDECTVSFECDAQQALDKMNELASSTLPLSGLCHFDNQLFVRLSGTPRGVDAAKQRLGGQIDDNQVWQSIKEHTASVFDSKKPLWRVSVPSTAALDDTEGLVALDWGGALRWYQNENQADEVRARAIQHGGHATLYRHTKSGTNVFQTPSNALMAMHRRVKNAFDPLGLFNPGRLYEGM